MSRLGSKKIISMLRDCLEQSSCRFSIEGTENPILLLIEDRVFTVFLKPIGDVCYDNTNESTRVQLPRRPYFDKIKASKRPFLLMGFDLDNNVFTIWNPISTKKRLNIKKNSSFYCRLCFQRKANELKTPIRCNLTNGDFVWVLPMSLLAEFLMYIEDFFPQVRSDEYSNSQHNYDVTKEYEELITEDANDIIDENGKIIAIKNPVILNELKIARKSGKPFAEYDVLYEHYSEIASNMDLAEWTLLLKTCLLEENY